jgi:hypothetical protein
MNGDEDEEEGYVFVASGDACGQCAALDGCEDARPPIHPNCKCQLREKGNCDWSYDVTSEGTKRTGSPSREGDYLLSYSVTVTCSDGTEIGESVQLDGHTLPSEYGDGDALFEAIEAEVTAIAENLATGCDCSNLVA